MRGIALTLVSLLVLEIGPGCSTVRPVISPASAAPKPATVPTLDPATTYSGGRASRVFAAPASKVHPAVLAAMDDVRVTGVRRLNDSGVVLFEGTTTDDRRVSVTLRSPNPGSTRLTARIGLFGDEPMSKALLERIGIRLGELPPAPIPTEIPSVPSPNPFFNFGRLFNHDSEMLKDMADSRFRDAAVP